MVRPLRVVRRDEPENRIGDIDASEEAVSDEELVAQLVAGQERAIAFLYHRYAQRVYNIAVHTLDRTAAEEIVQDVMLAVWQKADTYDPTRGPFRAWVLRIAQLRIINELRRRSRRPITTTDPSQHLGHDIVDTTAQPDAVAIGALRDDSIRAALDTLPSPQRTAVQLAFLKDLTHEQTAAATATPLGTTKTRIRTGLRALRHHSALVALVSCIVVVVGATIGTGVTRTRSHTAAAQRSDRAIHMLAASDVTARRLLPPVQPRPGVAVGDSALHATYRSRPGSPTIVLTLSHFAPAPRGFHYVAWGYQEPNWRKLRTLSVKPDGTGLTIVEDPHLAATPDRLEVTLETDDGATTPSLLTVVAWPTTTKSHAAP